MTNEEIAIELTNHDDHLKITEKGVSNFRNFQAKMDRKVGFVYGATWTASIFGVVALAIFSWVLSLIVPAAKIIVEDYYRNHPNVVIHAAYHSSTKGSDAETPNTRTLK
jgi:hypothetical protein